MASTANCPKCGRRNDLPPCPNDGSFRWTETNLSDGTRGIICNACKLGYSVATCQYDDCDGRFSVTLFR